MFYGTSILVVCLMLNPVHIYCHIIKEWLFLYKSFIVDYILSFSVVELWTIWVKSSGALSWGTVLRSRAKDRTITIVKIKRHTGNWVWMTSCPEEIILKFEDFEKESVESWHWTMEADSWVFCHWVIEFSFLPLRLCFLDLYRQRWIEILNTTRCAER